MPEFHVFVRPSDAHALALRVPLKWYVGPIWPIWFLLKGAYRLGLLLLALFVLLVYARLVLSVDHNILFVPYVLLSALVSGYGNAWLVSSLVRRGYRHLDVVETDTEQAAVSIAINSAMSRYRAAERAHWQAVQQQQDEADAHKVYDVEIIDD
jgi:hypothetical protein